MSSKPEITWSLMHPTPLDIQYMKEVIARAAEYNVNSFEICADCHTNLGGMDGLTDYAVFPHAAKKIDRRAIIANREKLHEILHLAHIAGKPVYYWHREAMVVDGLLEDMPGLLDENGEFDLLGSAYEELLRYKIAASFDAVPELDGLVLTLTEATYSVIHSSNQVKYPAAKVVEHIVRIFAGELARRNKRFILRSFGSIVQDYEDIIAGAAAVAKDHNFEIETKITPYDFDPFLPVNPFLHKQNGVLLGAECDGLGEFLGAGVLPAENVENIVRYVRTGQAADVDRYAIRIDRIGNRIFDCYEINLYAYHRAVADKNITAEDIRREYLDRSVPPEWRTVFDRLGKAGFELVKKNNFIDGNVIFHQFPTAKTLKMLKAGFIFALFKNDVSLANGSEVWSILSENRTPGRKAILAEKREAVEIARMGNELLAGLKNIPGFERELAWRKKLWGNAMIAVQAFYELCNIICAYFDDMENGNYSGTTLHQAVTAGKTQLNVLAGYDLSANAVSGEHFVNGLEQHLFRSANDAKDIYLEQFYAIFGLLETEFHMESAMRQKYTVDAFDAILCGAITDEWRIKRYMHAGHATVNNGEIFRFAGNTVFPNGFLEMTVNTPSDGGILDIYGETLETADFTLEIDGIKEQKKFSADGKVSVELPVGKESVLIRLSKAPGNGFPGFRAVTVNIRH